MELRRNGSMTKKRHGEEHYKETDPMILAELCDTLLGRNKEENTSHIMVFHIQEGMEPMITECIDRSPDTGGP